MSESASLFDDGKDPQALRTIGEVSNALGIKPHVLRYWEEQFPMLKPTTRAGGRRYYRAEDIALVRRIDDLRHAQPVHQRDLGDRRDRGQRQNLRGRIAPGRKRQQKTTRNQRLASPHLDRRNSRPQKGDQNRVLQIVLGKAGSQPQVTLEDIQRKRRVGDRRLFD